MVSSYYSILHISTSATQRDIKRAYRKLAQKHHPDVNKSGSDELIKLINIAYETLSDPSKKAIYDQRLAGAFHQAPSPTYSPTSPKRRAPPHSFYRYQKRYSDTYTYSTKTKLQGWGAVILTILLIWIGIRAMDYYASKYYYDKAVIAENNHNYNEALGLYQLAIRKWSSKSVEASIQIVELNQHMGAYHAMVDHSEIGFGYEPDSAQSARLYYLKGIGYTKTERYEEAEKAYLNSLNFNYNKDTIYHQLGLIYINHLEQYDKAVEIYSFLLASNSINLANYYNRGISYQHIGEHQKAIDDFLAILKNDPYNSKILFQLGRSNLALNQKALGCQYLRKAQNQGANINPDELALACGF